MKESQYTEVYLRGNARRGKGKGITIGTFLSYTLRGKAKGWISRYAHALERSVINRDAIKGRSKCGSIAYYPKEKS